MRIYRNCNIPLSKGKCATFLQNLARCNGRVSSSFCPNSDVPDREIRRVTMCFSIYFLTQSDLDKFHQLGMVTSTPEIISQPCSVMPARSIELDVKESRALILYAFRYCLSRRSYAVREMCDFLRARWDELDSSTQQLIIKEIQEAISKDDESLARIELAVNAGADRAEAQINRYFMAQDRLDWEAVLKVVNSSTRV